MPASSSASGSPSVPVPALQRVAAGGLTWWVLRAPAAAGAGPAPPRVLLLHGTGASVHSWRALLAPLQARAEVLAPDLPGHGGSARLPAARQSLAGMAAALQALLERLDVQPDLIVGHSAGAALMLRRALDVAAAGATPGRAPRLIGLNPALQPFDQGLRRLYAPAARLLAGRPLVAQLAAWHARDPAVVRRVMAATGSQLDAAALARYGELLSRADHVGGVLAMMANWDLEGLQRDLLDGRRCLAGASLALWTGARDTAVAPLEVERFARRLRASRPDWPLAVERLEQLGHLAHEEAPALLAQRLLDELAVIA